MIHFNYHSASCFPYIGCLLNVQNNWQVERASKSSDWLNKVSECGLQSLFVSGICQVRWIFSSTIPQKQSLSGPLNNFFILETSVNQVSYPIVLDCMKCNSVKADISDYILKWHMHHFSSHSFSCIFRAQVDIRKLKRNAVIVAESLARFMYNLSDKVRQTFGGSRQI